jgi:hypothetical protein
MNFSRVSTLSESKEDVILVLVSTEGATNTSKIFFTHMSIHSDELTLFDFVQFDSPII